MQEKRGIFAIWKNLSGKYYREIATQSDNGNTFTSRTQHKTPARERTMSYSKACEILGYTTPKSVEANAKLAETRLRCMPVGTPLRYAVACDVLIRAAK